MSNMPPLYEGGKGTKWSPWFALPIAAVVILVALIVVAVTRSSHPHPALAAARHHATSHDAVAKSKTTKTTTTTPKPASTTPAPTSPPVARGASTPIGYVSKPYPSASAALQSVGVPPSYPDIEIVAVPGGHGKWAIEPEAISVQGHDQLSMAWTIADGQWEAWTTTFPGGAPSGVPFALYDAANIGYNLHEGIQMPGPASGTVPWDSITGQVTRPEGWWVSDGHHIANGQPAVLFTVLVEEVGSSVFHGSYGIEVVFAPQNLTTGDGSITEIEGDGTPATSLAKTATCTPPGLRVQCTSAPA